MFQYSSPFWLYYPVQSEQRNEQNFKFNKLMRSKFVISSCFQQCFILAIYVVYALTKSFNLFVREACFFDAQLITRLSFFFSSIFNLIF